MTAPHPRVLSEDTADLPAWQAPLVEGPISAKLDDIPPRPPTAREMQVLHKQAYDEGFAMGRREGYEKGMQDAARESRDKLEKERQALQLLFDRTVDPFDSLQDEVEQFLTEVIIQTARHFIRRELKTDPGEVIAVVREALAALPVSARNPRIYLHPEDAELVRNVLSLGEDKNWRIEEDLLMMRGDCRIETDVSLVDASVEAKLSAIAARFLGRERDSDAGL